jgi:glycosyltransferase involved in cell wall biosynthesis
MKISVALATYNGEKFIIEQLQSLLEQTLAADEVIVKDDCSTDHTVLLVNEFIEKNHLTEKWKCSVNGTNKGFAENFKGAIDETTGDLIFCCDQDDIWLPDHIEKMAAVMEKDGNIGLLCSRFLPFAITGNGEKKYLAKRKRLNESVEKIKLTPYTRYLRSLGCLMCVRRDFYEEIKVHWYEDWAHDEFLWSLAVLSDKCYIYNYYSLERRVHENNYSGSMGHTEAKRVRYLEDVLHSSNVLLEIAQQTECPEKIINLYRKNIKMAQMRLSLLTDKNVLYAFRLAKYLQYYYSKKSYFRELLMAVRKK